MNQHNNFRVNDFRTNAAGDARFQPPSNLIASQKTTNVRASQLAADFPLSALARPLSRQAACRQLRTPQLPSSFALRVPLSASSLIPHPSHRLFPRFPNFPSTPTRKSPQVLLHQSLLINQHRFPSQKIKTGKRFPLATGHWPTGH
jgi:hypothetical protein